MSHVHTNIYTNMHSDGVQHTGHNQRTLRSSDSIEGVRFFFGIRACSKRLRVQPNELITVAVVAAHAV